MKISVAICTWNRARLLDQTLAQLHNLRVPTGIEWELLVVNNGSTDDTDAVIARNESSLPLRRLFEPDQGLSNARNRALSACAGELILWTDDDVLLDPGWLEAYLIAARLWPEACYFGGLIEPFYERAPPVWIRENLGRLQGMLVIHDLGSSERPFVGKEQPWGANMAFRTEVLRRHPFDPNLGLKGQQILRGEETEVFAQLRSEGAVGVWVPSARVRHLVPAKRMTIGYMREFYLGVGRTSVRMEGLSEAVPTLLGGAAVALPGSCRQCASRGLGASPISDTVGRALRSGGLLQRRHPRVPSSSPIERFAPESSLGPCSNSSGGCDGPGALAQAVIELLADPDPRARMGEAAPVWLAQRFDWESLSLQAEAIFQRESAIQTLQTVTAS